MSFSFVSGFEVSEGSGGQIISCWSTKPSVWSGRSVSQGTTTGAVWGQLDFFCVLKQSGAWDRLYWIQGMKHDSGVLLGYCFNMLNFNGRNAVLFNIIQINRA